MITEDYLHSLHHRLYIVLRCTFRSYACLSGTVTNSASRLHLRSAAQGDLQVLATRVTYGPRSFAACAQALEQPSNHTSTLDTRQ